MSLAGRVGAAFLVLIALMVALAGYHLSLVHRLHEDNRRLIRVELELSRISLTMRRDVEELLRLTQVFFVLRDAGYEQRMQARRERVEAGLDRLREMEVTPEEQGALAFFAVAWREYADRAPQVEADFLASGNEGARAELIAELAAFDESLVALDTAARQAMDEQVAASAEKAARAQTTAWATTTAAAGAALVLALLLAGSVARPLSRLGRGTHEMAEGNFGYRVEASGGRELVALADDFNRMADRLGELDELKKDFVSTMSHDLKAPLASMQE
ncbi:MAG TPA: HAMP domain-containing protein, partial [Thermoanaerobaculia bacterium]|nr:HAMP domain-containing protein [Thermoanaerobaculia bacterium]